MLQLHHYYATAATVITPLHAHSMFIYLCLSSVLFFPLFVVSSVIYRDHAGVLTYFDWLDLISRLGWVGLGRESPEVTQIYILYLTESLKTHDLLQQV